MPSKAGVTLRAEAEIPTRQRTEPSLPPLAGGTYKDGVQVERLVEEPQPEVKE